MRMARAGLAGMLLGCTYVSLVAGCGEKATPAIDRPPAPVAVAAAVARDVPVYLEAIGKTIAREVVSVQPQVSGPIHLAHFTRAERGNLVGSESLATETENMENPLVERNKAGFWVDDAPLVP